MRESATQTPIPAHILLVDDNRLGLVARKSVLEELGYRITTAADGQAGLDHYNEGSFDLVITDFKMPKMDGLELIRRIRARKTSTPIILVSGYADAMGLTEGNSGADAVISKSANEVVQLVRCVSRLLKRAAAPKKGPGTQPATTLRAKRHSAQ